MPKLRADDGVELHYHLDDFRDPWVTDPGDTILLFQGFARSMKWWNQWVPPLSRKYRVLRYDTRGCGESSVPSEGAIWSVERLNQDVLQLIDHLGIEKIHWVGFESGGLWGIVFAVNYPDRIKSLTLCSTPAGKGSGHLAATGTQPSPAEVIKAVGFRQWLIDTKETRIDLAVADPRVVDWYLEENAKTPTDVAVSIMEVADGCDVAGMHSRIGVPTLILVAQRAKSCPLEEQVAVLRAIPDARMVVLPNIGAGFQLLMPDRCVEEVLGFLGSE